MKNIRIVGFILAACACSVYPLVPANEVMPMDETTLANGSKVWIPMGVSKVRGILLSDNLGLEMEPLSHNSSIFGYLWQYAVLSMQPEGISSLTQFLDDAGKASNHTELGTVPVIWVCGRWLNEKLAGQIKSRIICSQLFGWFQ